MKILSLDTTCKTASVSLSENGKLLASETWLSPMSHSSTLLVVIDQLLNLLSWKTSDLDLLVCGAGPGSYTGIRIGISTLKGLAFVRKIPCVGVSSLHGLAYQMRNAEGRIVPVINARRNQVYTAVFDCHEGKLTRRCEDRVAPVSELIDELSKEQSPVFFTGDGRELFPRENCPFPLGETPENLAYPSAVSLSEIGEEIYLDASPETRDELFAPAALRPIYLQKVQAEKEREERIKGEST